MAYSNTPEMVDNNIGTPINLQRTDMDLSVAPSGDEYKTMIQFADKNAQELGNIMGIHWANDTSGIHLEAGRTINGTRYYQNVRLLIDANGNKLVSLTPDPWLTALGLQPTIYSSQVGTANLTSAGSYNYVYKLGRLVICHFNLNLKAVSSSGSAFITGLPKPANGHSVALSLASNDSAKGFYISGDGELRNDDATITATWHNGSVVYVSET